MPLLWSRNISVATVLNSNHYSVGVQFYKLMVTPADNHEIGPDSLTGAYTITHAHNTHTSSTTKDKGTHIQLHTHTHTTTHIHTHTYIHKQAYKNIMAMQTHVQLRLNFQMIYKPFI